MKRTFLVELGFNDDQTGRAYRVVVLTTDFGN
jgi:hypothetical protein